MGKTTIAWTAGLVAWIALPIVALVVLTTLSLSATISGPQVPSWVPVRASADASSEPVDLALQWHASKTVFAPAWSGLVQSSLVKPGDVLHDGTPIAVIDGITRTAALTLAPFYRSITYGTRGDDVAWLNAFLSRLGIKSGTGQSATRDTMAAVKKFALSVGASYHGAFEVAWVVFVPSADFKVATVDMVAGMPAPTAGATILHSTATLSRATVVNIGSLGDVVAQPPQNASSPFALDDTIIRAKVKAIPQGAVLEVDGKVFPTDSDSIVESASTPSIESLVTPNTPLLQANLVRTTRPGDVLIPTAAVFSGDSGKTCVIAKSRDGQRAVRVTIVADSGEQLIVEGGLDPTMSVRVPAGSGTPCG